MKFCPQRLPTEIIPMRRQSKWIGLLLVPALLTGCNAIWNLIQPPFVETGSSQLKAFESEGELASYFKRQIDQRNSYYADFDRNNLEESGDMAGAPPEGPLTNADGAAELQPTPAPGDDFSGTTIQEAGVDESDVVKTDGTYLYIIDSVSQDSVLRIVQVSLEGQIALVSETTLTGYGRDLYLHGDKVVAITTGGGYYYAFAEGGVAVDARATDGDAALADDSVSSDATDVEPINTDAAISIAPPFGGDDFVYERPHTIVTVVDVTARANPAVLSQTKFDGTQSATRMIDGVLHMVVANYQDYYFDVLPLIGRPELDVAAVEVETLLPTYVRKDADGSETAGSVVTWRELYHPTDPDGFGVVTLVSLDVDNNAQFTAVGVVAEPGLIYSSLQALYLTDTNYDWQGNNRTTTDIYKFAYANRGATPVGTGTVQGRILNQYSMGEHTGNLRVATTIDPTWFFDETGGGIVTESSNQVYVLSHEGDALNIIGSIENIAVGETLQSARFAGDRGYLVTFEQIDPLFTLDLADARNPRVVGELEVPGFSTFVVPMDENHLLTIGQYVPPPGEFGNWGVQVSIFDVTDFANPVRSSNVIIGGDTGAYSEATWDPKAFNYFASRGLVALPVSIYPDYGNIFFLDGDAGAGTSGSSDGETDVAPPDTPVDIDFAPPSPVTEGFDGLFVYSASAGGGLTELGRINTRFEEAGYWGSSFTRGVFIGEKIYAVTNLGVRSASVNSVATVESELFFGVPYIEQPPIPVEPLPQPLDPSEPDIEGEIGGSGGTEGGVGSASKSP